MHEDRLTPLEIKTSFLEDQLEQLDAVVARQQQQIDLLTRELLRLRELVPQGPHGLAGSAQDERPPHY
ncbi:MAG: SlyX family protein [Burkholderiales bacterium]|uniref:SlyX family protein n=1 Tax=Inhella sp. TaxID=1921806 RepID=UPI001AC8565A|nr:SlyX family protein [Burkholderiales bacterium]